MKALTICQPYASLIASGEKWVENRTWCPNAPQRLAIHAGKSREWCECDEDLQLPFGAIVAVADLRWALRLSRLQEIASHGRTPRGWVDCGLPTLEVIRRILDHTHTEGPCCLVFDFVYPVVPVLECRGAQGIWPLDANLVDELRWRTAQRSVLSK